MTTRYDSGTTGERSNTLAAVFATEHDARDAIKNLHKAGFKQTWLGKTRENDRTTGEPTVEADGGAIARFLSAGAERRPLHRALIDRGISETQAQSIEADIAPGNVIVTVYGEDNPDRATECLADAKGQVVDDADMPTAVRVASLDPRTGVEQKDRNRDTVQSQRGDDRDETSATDVDAYEGEEFIATGRGYTPL